MRVPEGLPSDPAQPSDPAPHMHRALLPTASWKDSVRIQMNRGLRLCPEVLSGFLVLHGLMGKVSVPPAPDPSGKQAEPVLQEALAWAGVLLGEKSRSQTEG